MLAEKLSKNEQLEEKLLLTKLVLGDQRQHTSGSVADFYNAGVKGPLDQMAQHDVSATIPPASQDAYLSANPFDPAKALDQINTRYWVASFLNGSEASANFRRSGFPALQPNPYPGADVSVQGGALSEDWFICKRTISEFNQL